MSTEIAQTIVNQINAFDKFAFFAWGVNRNNPILIAEDKIQFKSRGLVKNKGTVVVEYNHGTDLYDLKFYNIRGNLKSTHDGIYVENLISTINQIVG